MKGFTLLNSLRQIPRRFPTQGSLITKFNKHSRNATNFRPFSSIGKKEFSSENEIVENFIKLAVDKKITPDEFREFVARLPDTQKESFERLNPQNNYPPKLVKELFLLSKDLYGNLSANAKSAFKRMLYEGASRGSINDEMFQGITLLYNVLSMVAYDVTSPRDIPAHLRKHSPGEGGIPPVGMTEKSNIYDDNGNLLFEYSEELFLCGKIQIASGSFLGADPRRSLIQQRHEIKDQSAKQGVGGRAPQEKVSLIVQSLRKVLKRELPSPGQRQQFKSVEEEDIYHIIASLFQGKEIILGSHGVISEAAAVQKVPSDTEVEFRAGAVIKANIPVIITGDGGGTGKTEDSFRRDAQQNSFIAALQTLNAYIKSDPDISVTGGMYGPRKRLLAYLLFNNVGGLTFPQFVAFGCIYAKLCHKSCPANLTTGKMDTDKVFDALKVIINDLTSLASLADDIGLDLTKGPLNSAEILNYVKPKPGSALESLLDQLVEKSKDNEQRDYKIITRSQTQIAQEKSMDSEKIPGGADFIGLGVTSVRRRYLENDTSEVTYRVGHAGTAAGVSFDPGQTLIASSTGDFAGLYLTGGSIFTDRLGRLGGLGAQSGSIFARDCDDGAFFGSSVHAVVGSLGSFSGLFIKRGHISVLPWISKANTGSLETVESYVLNTNLGSTVFMPKKTFDAITLLPAFVMHNKVDVLSDKDFISLKKDFKSAVSGFDLSLDEQVLGHINDWIKVSPESCDTQHEQVQRLFDLNMVPKELSQSDLDY